MTRRTVYFPHNTLLFAVLSVILFIIIGLFLAGVISAAFLEVGLSPALTIMILFATFLGGFVNIPLLRLEATVPVVRADYVRFFGVTYRIPNVEYEETTTLLTVNVGGALIPAFVASYLLYKLPSAAPWSLVGTIAVALVTHMLAKPVSGVGIVTPVIVPPLAAALVGFFLPSGAPRVVAYISGVLGTLVGADLSNLAVLPKLGAPVVSIGGAGTFDGVFLTGIIAVLLT